MDPPHLPLTRFQSHVELVEKHFLFAPSLPFALISFSSSSAENASHACRKGRKQKPKKQGDILDCKKSLQKWIRHKACQEAEFRVSSTHFFISAASSSFTNSCWFRKASASLSVIQAFTCSRKPNM
jgi:hypothetical protein